MSIHLALVDDHSVLAEALAQSLSRHQDLVVEHSFSDPHACLEYISTSTRLDVLVSDYAMPTMNGIDLCIEAKRRRPLLRCVLLSMHDTCELRYRCARANIEGCLPKTSSVAEIQQAVVSIAQGATLADNTAIDDVEWNRSESVVLSPSEIEVVRCIVCLEMTSRAAAEHLHRSHHTIEQHRKNIYAKLGIDSVAALTKYAMAAGICSRITAE